MLSDDVYRARLQATIAALRYWTPEIKDVARVEEADGLEFWKLKITPHVLGACPVELMLRTDQKHDLIIAGEVYEDRSNTALDRFVPLMEAIAAGKVVQRLHRSAATGTPLYLTTVIEMEGGKRWTDDRDLAGEEIINSSAPMILDERHFLPYRRG